MKSLAGSWIRRLLSKFHIGVLLVCVAAYADVALTPAGDGHLVLPAYVNGRGPFPFILDTGADGIGLYHWFALKEKLKPGKPELMVGQTGSTKTNT